MNILSLSIWVRDVKGWRVIDSDHGSTGLRVFWVKILVIWFLHDTRGFKSFAFNFILINWFLIFWGVDIFVVFRVVRILFVFFSDCGSSKSFLVFLIEADRLFYLNLWEWLVYASNGISIRLAFTFLLVIPRQIHGVILLEVIAVIGVRKFLRISRLPLIKEQTILFGLSLKCVTDHRLKPLAKLSGQVSSPLSVLPGHFI